GAAEEIGQDVPHSACLPQVAEAAQGGAGVGEGLGAHLSAPGPGGDPRVDPGATAAGHVPGGTTPGSPGRRAAGRSLGPLRSAPGPSPWSRAPRRRRAAPPPPPAPCRGGGRRGDRETVASPPDGLRGRAGPPRTAP